MRMESSKIWLGNASSLQPVSNRALFIMRPKISSKPKCADSLTSDR